MMDKKNSRVLSILLVVIMMATFTTNVFAQDTTSTPNFNVVSQKYINPDRNNGVYLIEVIQIEGKTYTFTHTESENQRIVEMKGAENKIFSAKLDEEGNAEDVVYRNANSNQWHPISEKRDYFYGGTQIGQAALASALATLVGGPVGAFIASASVIIGAIGGYRLSLVVYTGGRWRIQGTSLKYEMYSRIHYGDGRITTARWSRTR